MIFTGTLKQAILEALAYSDIFEYPLQLNELHRYLPIYAEMEQLSVALGFLMGEVGEKDGLYYLAGREDTVKTRKMREAHSQKLLPVALKYGSILGSLPFVRMVALTGSLAVMNCAGDADFDYMLVTAPNHVWTARAFALLLNRFAHLFGHTLCPNLVISENALSWSSHDLYSARELCQMIPITGMDSYRRLMKANEWAKDFLPNADLEASSSLLENLPALQGFLELPLHGKLGNHIEHWEMNRKITRFSKQTGFGEETVFNANVCQGNFGHHKKWTQEAFQKRLRMLNLESDRSLSMTVRANSLVP
jgi:hypothetical protein